MKTLRMTILRLWVGLRSIVMGVLIGAVFSEFGKYGAIDTMSMWVAGFMEKFGMDVRYIVFGVVFATSYFLLLGAIVAASVWLTCQLGSLIHSKMQSNS